MTRVHVLAILSPDTSMHARDIFICHAHADKEGYVLPLAIELRRRGVSYWLDSSEIRAGESFVEAIGGGLRNASRVAVLITENFAGRAWPEKELNVATAMEIPSRSNRIIPILAADPSILHRYPLLLDTHYLTWSGDPGRVADEIAELFLRVARGEWHHYHPAEYVGPVWVRVLPQLENRSKVHQLTLRWGSYMIRLPIRPDDEFPSSLTHHKLSADNVPLLASIEPEAVLTFGTGPAPDDPAENIDEGWTRTGGGDWRDLGDPLRRLRE